MSRQNKIFDNGWDLWMREIGMAKDRYAGAAKATKKTNGWKKVLVIPDLHVPFHEPKMLADMLAREGDADHAICIGDLGDSYSLSRFVQYKTVPFGEEWAAVTAVMQTMSESFPAVTVISGNHDARLERQLRSRMTLDMVDAVKLMAGGTLDPIAAVARRFSNITMASHETPSGHRIGWFTIMGDAWFGHPEKFSRTPGAAIRGVEEWLTDNRRSMGLREFRLVLMGHTHQLVIMPWRGDQLLVECGCLCQTQSYMMEPKIGGRPQKRGYVTFQQKAGRTDLNSVKMHWFDVEEGR